MHTTGIQQLVAVVVLIMNDTVWGEDCSSVAPMALRSASPPWDALESQPRATLPKEVTPALLCLVVPSANGARRGSKCRANGRPRMELAFWVGRATVS